MKLYSTSIACTHNTVLRPSFSTATMLWAFVEPDGHRQRRHVHRCDLQALCVTGTRRAALLFVCITSAPYRTVVLWPAWPRVAALASCIARASALGSCLLGKTAVVKGLSSMLYRSSGVPPIERTSTSMPGNRATPYLARFQQNVVPPTDIGNTKASLHRSLGATMNE